MGGTAAMNLRDEALLTALFCRAMRDAGDALFEMTGRTVEIAAPEMRRCTPSQVLELAGGADALVVSVYVGITGGIRGHALLVLPVVGALRLADRLVGDMVEDSRLPASPVDAGDPFAAPAGLPELDDLRRSALLELGNVTIAAALNELGDHLGSPIHPTVPEAVTEYAGAVLDAVLLDLVSTADDVLAARTVFVEGADTVDGMLLVLPRSDSLGDLVSAARAPRWP